MSLNTIEAAARIGLATGALFVATHTDVQASEPSSVFSKPTNKIDAPRYKDELRIPEMNGEYVIVGLADALQAASDRRSPSRVIAAGSLRSQYPEEISIPETNSQLGLDGKALTESRVGQDSQTEGKNRKDTPTNRVAVFAGQFDNSDIGLNKAKLVSDENGQREVVGNLYPNDEKAQKEALRQMRINRGTYYLTPYNAPSLGSTKDVVGMEQSGGTLVVYTQEERPTDNCYNGDQIQQAVRVFMVLGLNGAEITTVREETVAPVMVNC